MANSRPDSKNDAARPQFLLRHGRRLGEGELVLQSDLSSDLEITPDEIDAIARLLGDDLKAFLSGS